MPGIAVPGAQPHHPNPPAAQPLILSGADLNANINPNALLFRLKGQINGHQAIFLLDSGASGEFIDTDFAARCGLKLTASDRTIRLADGSIADASGHVTTDWDLAPQAGAPLAFNSSFTATALSNYDAILGMSWLEAHDPLIGWRNRTITVRSPGQPHRCVKPLECLNPSAAQRPHLATISFRGLERAKRHGQIEEAFAIFVRPGEKVSDTTLKAIEQIEDLNVRALMKEFADVAPEKLPAELPPKRGVEHRIELKPDSRLPPVRPLRHQSAKDLEVFDAYIKECLAAGIIRPSHSPYGAMALIVKKKDGTPRVVVDYRGLNDITVKNSYPLPLMDELFDRVFGAEWFSKLDLRTGFHQILLADGDSEKTAFRTRFGSFEYRVLPMGLCNAPGTFMQLMNDTFRDMLDKNVIVFLDDILVFSRTKEEHMIALREVLTRLRASKLYVKLSKCEFMRKEVEFLGHRLGASGLGVSPDKIAAVKDWPQPTSVSDIRSFLGLAGFYRRFVKDFSKIALPITELTKNDSEFVWGEKQQKAFDELKKSLCSAPVLLIPDPKLPYTLNVDACDYAVGGTLQQDQGNGLQPVAFRSRKLTPAERNYDVREKEFLAFFDACSVWRQYLHNPLPFTFLTDHDSLKYHRTMPNLSQRLARWIEKLAEFDYKVEHIAGVKNIVADALSRRSDLKESGPDSSGSEEAALYAARVARGLPPPSISLQEAKDAAEKTLPPAPDRPAPNKHGAIVMPSQQCSATAAKSGCRCKAKTAKGQYCWNHLRSIRGLRIKKVPGKGFGLFADRHLPSGTSIDYTGDRVVTNSDRVGGEYFLQDARGSAIDAARTNSGEGRWVNDPRGSDKRANALFVLHTPRGESRRACVRTTRPVQKGEEILVAYGRAYWRYHLAKMSHQGAAVVASVTTTTATATSELTEELKRAAVEDRAYAARVSAATGNAAREGMLIDEGRVIVPNSQPLRIKIMAECHDSVTGAHFGRDKTLSSLQSRFQWPGLAKDVDQYVASCNECQRNKPSRQLKPGLLMPLPIPSHPCAEWTEDAVTGLPMTKHGHDAIQVYVERLCKIKRFGAGRKTDGAIELAKSFAHHVVRTHGVPERVVSDRDPRFTAHFYAELSKLLGITLSMSTARHAQTDGQSEREIQSLQVALRAFCNDHQDDWDEYLDMLELGFNSAVQASTGRSPHELLFGTKPRLPVDIALIPFLPKNPAAIDRAARMRNAISFAKDRLLTAQERQSLNANHHRREVTLKVGDQVLLSTEGLELKRGSNKLCSRFIGPFSITAVVNRNAYTLALPPQLEALHPTFNIEKLKLYRDGRQLFPGRPQRYDRPPPAINADSNGDEEFVVDRILAKRTSRRGGASYLVSWVGYPPEENTWEPRASLHRTLVAEFETEQTQYQSE